MDGSTSAAAHARTERGSECEITYNYWTDIVSGMVVAEGNSQLLLAVTDGLTVQQQNGTLTALMTKHGPPPELLIKIEARK